MEEQMYWIQNYKTYRRCKVVAVSGQKKFIELENGSRFWVWEGEVSTEGYVQAERKTNEIY